ncbi:MAG: hypothetical protein QMD07_03920 [Thermodesulfovibrionales bacterium]|nr:hypothetical protein [Thermodesulfovibrionales bacterium]
MRLNAKAFALTAAILFGVISFILTLISVLTGYARQFFELIAPFHPGYTHTFLGALISAFWMFVYGYILGAFFARIYNAIAKE